PVTVADPHVSADVLVHADGRRFVWLVSQSPDPLVVRPAAEGKLHDLADGAPVQDVALDAYGVAVLELR
ncbi:beta-mannosidase, partial [Streptomyces anthocyanicus]